MLIRLSLASAPHSAPIGLALFVGFMGFTEGRDVQGVQNKFTEVRWLPVSPGLSERVQVLTLQMPSLLLH